ncbi:alpha/beta hydrolase [Patescibacteria group bacterium]|nr:alpha/beta hydrolase [Patescibacteria group bacterium]
MLHLKVSFIVYLIMLTDHTIIIDGAQIRYTMSGDRTKQLLVFLHGWPGLSFLKSTVLHELEKDFRVVAPELPGFL